MLELQPFGVLLASCRLEMNDGRQPLSPRPPPLRAHQGLPRSLQRRKLILLPH